MTTEEKFTAAVNVIRSLPKNGSFQPTNDLLLRFYAYFKQATQGPCIGSRPAFWDPVGRAKYDAWKKIASLSKADAMAKYVDELHEIVETMSYSDKVASFLNAPNEIENINMADLELVVGDVMERVRSQPNSPFGSREASPQRSNSSLDSPSSTAIASIDTDEHSDNEYVDTIEAPEPKRVPYSNGFIPNEPLTNGYSNHKSRSKTKHISHKTTAVNTTTVASVDISQEVTRTVQTLRSDLDRLATRVATLEKATTTAVVKQQRSTRRGLLGGISPKLLILIITWPFVAHFIISRLSKKR